MDVIIPAAQKLLQDFRSRGLPVIHTAMAHDVVDSNVPGDMGLWHHKIPIEVLKTGSETAAIDSRIAALPGEHVIVKKRACGFHGTFLAGMLKAMRVDTVIVTGMTAAACVRNSMDDALAEVFRPIAVREAIGDRTAGAVEWNPFDIDAKSGDVEPLSRGLDYLNSNDLDV